MRICPNCELENAEAWTYCRGCGFALSPEDASEKQQLISRIDRQSQNQVQGSLYQRVTGAKYRTHYFIWLLLLAVWTIWLVALQLITGGLESFLPFVAFAISAVLVIPLLALLTWLIFKLLSRRPVIET